MKQFLQKPFFKSRLKFLFHGYRYLRSIYWQLLLKLNVDINKTIRYQLETADIMQQVLREDSNCVDVGCHEGAVLKEILRYSPNGIHYAFEPIPELYQELKIRFPKAKVNNVALSDKKGQAIFYDIFSRRGHSGLKSRNLEQTETIREMVIQTDLLDNLLPDDLPINLIKIDVEGAELAVLRGATKTIKKYKPIVIFEHGLGGANFFNTLPQDVYDLLVTECGLSIFTLKNWLAGRPPVGRQEFVNLFDNHLDYYFIAHK